MRERTDSLPVSGTFAYVNSHWLLLVGGVLIVQGNLVVYENPSATVAWYGLVELIFGILVCVWYSTRVVDARLLEARRDRRGSGSGPSDDP